MFHIPFLMVFYHVRTIIVPIGICVSAFICAGVYNLINRVIAHFSASVSVCICTRLLGVCVHLEVPPARMWVLMLPLGVLGCSEGSALFMNQAYWPSLWSWHFLPLSFCPPVGAYCEPAWLEERAQSDWTKRQTHHWAALPASAHSSLSLDAAGVCTLCACAEEA